MTLMEFVAGVVVLVTALYFALLGVAALVVPERVKRFLLGFAATPRLHFAELLARVVVGAALVVRAPHMAMAAVFEGFGWLLLASSTALLLIPWRWHQRFARTAVPRAVRYVSLIGVASVVIAVVLLLAAVPTRSL